MEYTLIVLFLFMVLIIRKQKSGIKDYMFFMFGVYGERIYVFLNEICTKAQIDIQAIIFVTFIYVILELL